MGRVIDTDAAYAVLTDYYHHTTDTQHAALREALGRVETVDAVPVVRCKDCKWFRRYIDTDIEFCDLTEHIAFETDFCSWGERKDGDHEKAD